MSDLGLTADDLRRIVIAHRQHLTSWADLAHAIGVSQGYLSNFIAGRAKPSRKLLRWLGMYEVVRYVYDSAN